MIQLEFCDNCDTRLRETKEGLLCPKCKTLIRLKLKVEAKSVKKSDSGAIYVVDKSNKDYAKVSRTCPKCGNKEAFRWLSSISGEHAGIRRERTVEHFKCTKCSHSWTESS